MSNIRQHIGVQQRHARKQIGLTQEQLAAMTKITTEKISRIELGNAAPNVDQLYRIAGALGMELGWPFDGVDEPAKMGELAMERRDDVRRVAANFDRIESRHVRAGVRALVREMADAEEVDQ